MKKIWIVLLTITMSVNTFAQTAASHGREVTMDEKSGMPIFKGLITLQDLEKTSEFTWYRSGIEKYHPDGQSITYLKYYLPKYKLVVFMGTWCDDSHVVIPKLVRVLQETNSTDNLVLYGVDRDKWSGNGKSKEYDVTRVPTIIVLSGDREIGRIKEYPNESVETDLAWIIDKDQKAQSTAHH
jgi:thiol-disulfide isomerase/thioredoxin